MEVNNKKAITLLMICLLSLNAIYSQNKLRGNKIVVSEDRGISEFSAIEVKDKIEVVLVQGGNQSVTVETDENLQFAVETDVVGGTLVIKLSKRIIKKKALTVFITIDENIKEITAKDRADVKGDGPFHFETLTINAEGDSKITMDIKSEEFTLNNNESANVNLTVNTNNSTINANSRGRAKINLSSKTVEVAILGNSTTELFGDCEDMFVTTENKSAVRAGKLECNTVIVNTSDASDAYVNAKESLTISAINSAEVYIYGNPTITIEKFADKAILRKKQL
jgi:hypothetical protein